MYGAPHFADTQAPKGPAMPIPVLDPAKFDGKRPRELSKSREILGWCAPGLISGRKNALDAARS